jgi:hypothetical protein
MPLTDLQRKEIFETIKVALKEQVPPMVVSKDTDTVYELMGNKPVPYGSAKKIVPGMYFSSVVARKDMISFYFFPVYMNDVFFELMPNLKKYLKGKTCFNFKKTDQIDKKELSRLLKKGVQVWKKLGYMQ